ncbi:MULTISPECIES: pilus assembly protein PilP [Pseudomonas]|jgi:type IV pilus assembly protein PilP|uniref:Type IV pili biogenesis protein n=1 Tax=Pseudomonas mosselii TaxID=78327 RepID=A0A5R8YXK9_9PSED|nr:pilus assembly protein PilP [Pseudomonas mosselii]TLP58173.1 type IV pili biogenesis protein [Pseudomonas mosselii]
MSGLPNINWGGLFACSRALRVAALLSVVMAVAGLAWGVSLRGLEQGYRAALLQADQAQTALTALELQVAALDVERATLIDVRQQLQEGLWRLDAGEGMSELLDQLAISGHEHGLVFEAVDVLDVQRPADSYWQMPLALQVGGRYPSLRAWLQTWTGQLRLLEIADLKLTARGDGSDWVSAQIRVHAYGASQALAPPASLADEPARAAVEVSSFDPFRPWSVAGAEAGLSGIALEQLQMVGSLSRGGIHQALVLAGGRLHRIRQGQRLGRDEGRVVHVDAQRMEVRERVYLAGAWQERSRFLALDERAPAEVMDEGEAVFDRGRDSGVDERVSGFGRAHSG